MACPYSCAGFMPARKKKRPFPYRRWLVLIAIAGLLFYFHKAIIGFGFRAYRELYERNYPMSTLPGTVHPPGRFSIHGIDVSRWQSKIDWSQVYGLDGNQDTIHISFAFIKATEGLLWEDPLYAANWAAAKKAGITRGAYHYFKPNSNAALQAKNFISSVKLKSGDLPPVVDVEERGKKGKKELVRSLKIFLDKVEAHYGVKPIIYSPASFIESYLAADFSDYPFWVAHYYVSKPKPAPGIDWFFWQYHDRAVIAGCKVYVDMNVFNGSRKEFEKLKIQ
jgi:lysozyme